MGMMKRLALLPMAALFAVACSERSPAPNAKPALNAQLRSDLDRAASPTSELAVSQFRATQGVSNVELGLANAHKMSIAPHLTHVPRTLPALHPTVVAVSAIPTAPAPTPTMIAVAPVPEPGAGPRPTPNPVPYPDGSGSGGMQAGVGPGGIIGVIIRGGIIGDDDHCEIHRPAMVGRTMPAVGMPFSAGGRGIGAGGGGARPRGIW